jgi:hypothetical protein
MKFHENPSGGSGVVPYGRRDTKTLIVDFVNAPKNIYPTRVHAT